MDGKETSTFRVGTVFYKVGKNDLGEVVGTVQVDDIEGTTTFTEQHASDKLFKLRKARQMLKKIPVDNGFKIYVHTNAIKNTKRMLRLIQDTKKQNGIPLDMPEI